MENFAFWDFLPDLKLPKHLPNAPIIKTGISKDWALVWAGSELLLINLKSTGFPFKPLSFSHKVSQIACNSSFSLILTNIGEVWAYGVDEFKSGLFGVNGISVSDQPRKLEALQRTHIENISIGKTHAAAINKEGILFTWGSSNTGGLGEADLGFSPPVPVKSADFFKAMQVVCGPQSTAVSTEGGFLYIFTMKPNCSKCSSPQAYPSTISSFQSQFIIKLNAFSEYLAVLNDQGECSIIGPCYCSTTLSCKYFIEDIAGCNSGLIGIDSNKTVIIHWKKTQKNWVGEIFTITHGHIKEIVGGEGKMVGLIGDRLGQKTLKQAIKGTEARVEKRRPSERLCFGDILSNCGVKEKVIQKDQGLIGEVIVKVVNRKIANVFREIWGCAGSDAVRRNEFGLVLVLQNVLVKAKLRMKAATFKEIRGDPIGKLQKLILALNRYKLTNIVSYFWRWKHSQPNQTHSLDLTKYKFPLILIFKILSTHLIRSKRIFLRKANPHRAYSKNLVKSLMTLALAYQKRLQKFTHIAFQKFLKNPKRLSIKKPLFIDPRYKIEIQPPNEFTEADKYSNSPGFYTGCNSDSDCVLSRYQSFKTISESNSPTMESTSNYSDSSLFGSKSNEGSLKVLVQKQISEQRAKIRQSKEPESRLGKKSNTNAFKTSLQLKKRVQTTRECTSPPLSSNYNTYK